MIYDRFLLLIWSVMLAFLCIMWLGTTNILSQILPMVEITKAADILFIVCTLFIAALLWFFVPRPLSNKIKVAASLPPLLFMGYILLW